KSKLNNICDAVLPTVEFIAPEVARAQRRINLARGRVLLSALTDEKLAAVIQTQPQWFLFRRKDNYVGFMKVVESQAEQEGAKGYEVRTFVQLSVDKASSVTLAWQVMFATADRQTERWQRKLWADTGSGEMISVGSEEGLKLGDTITCTLTVGDEARERAKDIPPGNVQIYLPKAFNSVPWRLIELNEPASYAFAAYNTRANAFDMRTLTVVGPERIELEGKQIDAIRVTDQVAEDVAAETSWLDTKGLVIQAERGEVLITAATREQVLKQFPKAEDTITKMSE
ncbi:MAG: hypothetical protein ACYTF6_04765, partial [Planctomycetota bacterium]